MRRKDVNQWSGVVGGQVLPLEGGVEPVADTREGETGNRELEAGSRQRSFDYGPSGRSLPRAKSKGSGAGSGRPGAGNRKLEAESG